MNHTCALPVNQFCTILAEEKDSGYKEGPPGLTHQIRQTGNRPIQNEACASVNRISFSENRPKQNQLQEMTRRIRLFLTDGKIKVDQDEVKLPVGIKRRMTGLNFKAFCQKYKGLLLFLKSGNSWQRVNDRDVVELTDDAQFRTERPVVRSAPSFNRD